MWDPLRPKYPPENTKTPTSGGKKHTHLLKARQEHIKHVVGKIEGLPGRVSLKNSVDIGLREGIWGDKLEPAYTSTIFMTAKTTGIESERENIYTYTWYIYIPGYIYI